MFEVMSRFRPSRRGMLVAACAVAASPLLVVVAQEVKARMGLHGMALLGGMEGLYASHMPMFHAPHDVQVILRLRAADQEQEAQLRQSLAKAPALWSIEPERFDLNRLQPTHTNRLTEFEANVYEGHFERKGQLRFKRVRLMVEQVPRFQVLNHTMRRANHQQFLLIGQGHEQFLVKHLDQRPDIDLIGYVKNQQPLHGVRTVNLSEASSTLAIPPAELITNALRKQGLQPSNAVTWVYDETGDLA